MQNEFDFHELKTTDRLPSPSGTALAIMKIVNREDSSLQQIAQLVKTDPALSGRLLSFANSPAFGVRRPVVDIQDTVLLVGMAAISNFALSLSLIGKYKDGRCLGFDYDAYWSRSLLFGVVLSAIMMRNRTIPPEEAFTLGLLADVGRLALATSWPDLYGECLETRDEKQIRMREQEMFAIDHNALTLLLLKDWGLPPVFLDALNQSWMGVDAKMQKTRTIRLARQLIFAEHLTRYCFAESVERDSLLPDLETEAESFHIDSKALGALIDDLLMQWRDLGRVVDVATNLKEFQPLKNDNDESRLAALELLIVDDDPLLLARLHKQLTAAGHRVNVCSDGEVALKFVVEQSVEMVITDWHMKPMNGLELCKSLRSTDFGKNLYIIMLTASEDEDSLIQAYASGIDDYVIKPVSLRVLLARMRAGQRILDLQNQLVKERQELERSSNELVVSNRRLQQIANTDQLTGVANRRYGMTRLEHEWDMAQRYNRPFSVLMMDLDYFKSINDTLGHDVGDKVLIHTAKIISENTRASDVVCRMGGEEFFVIATNTDQTAAKLLAERIRSNVASNQIKDVKLPRPLTISIGVAASVGYKPAWQELLKMADQALYQAKKNSRNAVMVAPL